MKKNLCVIYLAIFALAMMPTRGWAETLPTTYWSSYADTRWYTDAISKDPDNTSFEIKTAAELAGLAQLVNNGVMVNDVLTPVKFSGKTITLTTTTDIDLADHLWTPIGTGVNTSFRGTFDGNGKVIENLNVDMNSNYAGLFGYVAGLHDSPTSILNLGIKSGKVQGTNDIGGLVGAIGEYVTLTNCYNQAEVVSSSDGSRIGGLVGSGYFFPLLLLLPLSIATIVAVYRVAPT